jgi:hypothetical protein
MLKRLRKERKKKMRARRTRVDRMEKEELMRWKEKKEDGTASGHGTRKVDELPGA